MNHDGQEPLARVAAVLGHELRNPLAAAVAGAMLLRDMLDQDDPRAAVADGVLRDLDRTSRLLTSYLDCARTGAPRRQLPLAAVCGAVAARHRDCVRLGGGLEAGIAADGALLERALENLVENATQAGAGTVTLRAEHGRDSVQLLVEDDGPGVPADLQQRIFEPGFSRRGSTGLGLAIVAQTVRAHGGSIRCVPRARGACFCLQLPAQPQPCLEPA